MHTEILRCNVNIIHLSHDDSTGHLRGILVCCCLHSWDKTNNN